MIVLYVLGYFYRNRQNSYAALVGVDTMLPQNQTLVLHIYHSIIVIKKTTIVQS